MTDKTERCEHGIRHPWACHECDERHTSEEVLAMMECQSFAGGTTLELVRHWMMSGDYPPNDWERQFAAAIDTHRLDTRTLDPTPVAWMYGRANFRLTRNFDSRLSETPLYAHPPTTNPVAVSETPVGDHQMVEARKAKDQLMIAAAATVKGSMDEYKRGYADAAREVPGRIVDWLREKSDKQYDKGYVREAEALSDAGDAIEARDWSKP